MVNTLAAPLAPGNGRACSLCHDDSRRRPRLYLKKNLGEFPKWDRREKKVITLGQKINQMLVRNLQGEAEELGSEKLVALEAYLVHISRQAD